MTAADPVFFTTFCLIRVYETLPKGFITPRSVVQVHSPLPDNTKFVEEASQKMFLPVSDVRIDNAMNKQPDYETMLQVAIDEARMGLSEGGIPIGAALFDQQGNLLGRGHNRRVQEGDPSVHGETDAFRKAGRQRNYRDKIMVTTLAPCWYCSGLTRELTGSGRSNLS